MLSLYDYLGRAAGSELGRQVADYAKFKKAKHETRYVSNPKYVGNVMLYEKEFLDEFFLIKTLFENPNNQVDFVELNTLLTEDSFREAQEEEADKIF